MLPYLNRPELWTWEQIDGEVPGEHVSVQLASLRLNMPECSLANGKRRGGGLLVDGVLGPLALLPGYTAEE
ncbi:hypothetical protein [Paenibacillus hamazuiensis]|uniref:hypothetical protein n=1 Tax=Paenibacillus hamazuiensis TaxID=2936508 RepID=UPI0020106598|nr:hypothetical protein [Paenibacillus hamazuiensis]